jgi:hypothetical protein
LLCIVLLLLVATKLNVDNKKMPIVKYKPTLVNDKCKLPVQ